MNAKTWLKKHSLLAYFALAYGLTWGGLLAVAAAVQFRFDQIGLAEVGLMFLAMAAGPSLSGALLTSLTAGRAGWHDLGARLGRWRVGLGWYGIALLTVPAVTLVILLGLSVLVYPDFRPGFNILGVVVGLMAGFFEELGWTGFALPRLQRRYSPFVAGLGLGLLWAAWHMAADFMGNIQAMGAAWPLHFFIYWLLPLTAYRVLMTWVYQNTGSLLLAQLMHAGYTGSQVLLSPPAASFADGLLWKPIFTLSLWLLVAVVAAAYGSSLARRRARLAA